MRYPFTSHPRFNLELRGFKTQQHILKQLFDHHRVPSAILLYGTSGIGKATLGYHWLRFLLANEQKPGSSLHLDAPHPIVDQVNALSHGDAHVLELEKDDGHTSKDINKEPSREISVSQVRAVLQSLTLHVQGNGYRVVLIDAVDDLNRQAWHALLKSLEEPKAKTHFVLISHQLYKVPETIRSRCFKIHCQALDETTFDQALKSQNITSSPALHNFCQGRLGLVKAWVEYTEWQQEWHQFLQHPQRKTLLQWVQKADEKPDFMHFLWHYLSQWAHQKILSTCGESIQQRWMDLFQTILTYFDKAQTLRCDKRQILLYIFFSLEDVLQPS